MTSPATSAAGAPDFPEYAPVPAVAKGAPLNEHGYHVWQVERNLYAVTDNVYISAFLTTPDGVVIFDAPPNIGHNIRRAVDETTAANGTTSQVTHLVYSHHHCDHQGAQLVAQSAERLNRPAPPLATPKTFDPERVGCHALSSSARASRTLLRTRWISSRAAAATPSMSKLPWMSPSPGCRVTGTDAVRSAPA